MEWQGLYLSLSLPAREWRIVRPVQSAHAVETTMSKGMDRKKEAKKKPAKTAAEKRAAKREKKQSRGFL